MSLAALLPSDFTAVLAILREAASRGPSALADILVIIYRGYQRYSIRVINWIDINMVVPVRLYFLSYQIFLLLLSIPAGIMHVTQSNEKGFSA